MKRNKQVFILTLAIMASGAGFAQTKKAGNTEIKNGYDCLYQAGLANAFISGLYRGMAPMSETAVAGAFNARTMMPITGIGALAFVAMLVLGAYAPDLRSGRNGGSHALSNGATGFSGIVRLAEKTGRNPLIVRSAPDLQSEDLTVISPEHGWTDLSEVLGRRGARATLLILPKWDTAPDKQRPGWVRVSGLLPAADPERTLYPATPFTIAREKTRGEPLRTLAAGVAPELQFLAPSVLQTVGSKDIEPLIVNARGATVLGKLKRSQLYVLTDPDLLNNHGMGDERQARAALALLE